MRALLTASPALAHAFERAAEALRRSTVHISTGGRSAGAGVIWSEDGLIVTNAHVATGPTALVQTADGQEMKATVAWRDTWRDLALLRAKADGLVPVHTGDDHALKPGSLVLALGHPLGWNHALAVGIVHRSDNAAHWIRADVRLEPGNSGGPLADAEGRVLGINTMVVRGLGLAVPVSAVRRFLVPPDQRPRIGVALRPVTLRMGKADSMGLLVLATEPGEPAAEAGITAGDVLTRVSGARIEAPYDLGDALAETQDAQITIEVLRAGQFIERTVPISVPAQAA
jgi:serine protease Do